MSSTTPTSHEDRLDRALTIQLLMREKMNQGSQTPEITEAEIKYAKRLLNIPLIYVKPT